jgi:hypothetical protein
MPPGYAPPGYPNPPAYPGPGPYAYGYPPGYGPHPYDPYDPYRATLPGTNTKAIAALVTSLAGLIFCGLPSIAGIILGIMAIRETKRTGQDGFGMAVAATVIGSAIVALILVYIVFVVVIAMSSSTPYVS